MSDQILLKRRWIGRFGNRMHQYAFGATYRHRFGIDFQVVSKWEGDLLFARKHHTILPDDGLRTFLIENQKGDATETRLSAVTSHFVDRNEPISEISMRDPEMVWSPPDGHRTFDCLCSYMPWVFAGMSRSWLLSEVFQFSDEVRSSDLYRRFEDRQGTYSIAHLRRDDIAKAGVRSSYPCISKASYEKAFKEFDVDPASVEWTTDDKTGDWGVGSAFAITGKKLGFRYPEGSQPDPDGEIFFDWFPDFLRLYFAREIFRANSSFSFWAGFLSVNREVPATVYSPRLPRKRVFYGDPETPGQEIECRFEKGNHPHWVLGEGTQCSDIWIL